jgi:hypothetical protein
VFANIKPMQLFRFKFSCIELYSRTTQPHIYMDVEFADGRFLFDQTVILPDGSYDWTAAGCVLQ